MIVLGFIGRGSFGEVEELWLKKYLFSRWN
jgi:hypothetical protein